jgi:hypothetical protein
MDSSMTQLSDRRSSDPMLRMAVVTAALCSVAACAYSLGELQPSLTVSYFLSLAPLFAVILWVQKDARRSGVAAVHDLGFFLWLAWPVLIPWYAFKTRGRRDGWKLLMRLMAIILAAYITAFLVYGLKYTIWSMSRAR